MLFGKWSYQGVECDEMSLMTYISVKSVKSRVYMPHTAGKYQAKQFQKARCPLIERLVNALMCKGRNNGKKQNLDRAS